MMPRYIVCAIPPTIFDQPKGSSILFLRHFNVVYLGCRGFWATCGAATIWRSWAKKSALL